MSATVTCAVCGSTELIVPGGENTIFLPARDILVYKSQIALTMFPPRSIRFFTCMECSRTDMTLHRYLGIDNATAQVVGRGLEVERYTLCHGCSSRTSTIDGYCSPSCARIDRGDDFASELAARVRAASSHFYSEDDLFERSLDKVGPYIERRLVTDSRDQLSLVFYQREWWKGRSIELPTKVIANTPACYTADLVSYLLTTGRSLEDVLRNS